MVNNLDWLGELSLIDFLRDTGKHFTIPYMLAKDSVQTRLERGLSFTEFSYMLLQAYDFAHLHRTMGVELQMGGADQWGNITAGLELIRRTSAADGSPDGQEPAHGLAYKLLLSPSGTQVRQERDRRLGLARSRPDLAVRLLPVLAQHRRSRCRDVPALVHRVPAGADRGARERLCPGARGPAGAAGAGARHHDPDPRRRGGGTGGRRFRGEVLERGDRRSGGAAFAVRVGRRVHLRSGGPRRGHRGRPGRGRAGRIEGRGAPVDRRRRRHDQRDRVSRTRRSSRIRSPGSGSTCGSASAAARSGGGQRRLGVRGVLGRRVLALDPLRAPRGGRERRAEVVGHPRDPWSLELDDADAVPGFLAVRQRPSRRPTCRQRPRSRSNR